MNQHTLLLFSPTTAQKIGLNESIVLNQLCYWQKKFSSFERWIYNSYEEWRIQFPFWSTRTIQRTFASLEKQKLIKSKRTKTCKFYQINLNEVKKFLFNYNATNCPLRNDNLADPIYKDTKTTHKNNSLCEEIIVPISEKKRVQEMIKIWEGRILNNKKNIILTQNRMKKLKKVFEFQFNSSINEWQIFVDKISKSEFLMGKVTNFKASLDWVIIEDNLVKVLDGNYDNQKNSDVFNPNIQEESNKSLKQIEEDKFLDLRWKQFLQKCIEKFGNGTYISWFSKIKFISEERGCLNLKTQSNFIKNWIENNYKKQLLEIGKDCFGIGSLKFIT